MKIISQSIKGEEFLWTLVQLEDGRIQATWREPITGAVGCVPPVWPSEFDDLEELGIYACNCQREQIREIGGVEYQLDNHGDCCVVTWLCDKTGAERRAKVISKRYAARLIPDADILHAVNTPILWLS